MIKAVLAISLVLNIFAIIMLVALFDAAVQVAKGKRK